MRRVRRRPPAEPEQAKGVVSPDAARTSRHCLGRRSGCRVIRRSERGRPQALLAQDFRPQRAAPPRAAAGSMSARLSVLSNGGGFGDASARGRGSSGDLLKPGSDGRLRWVRQGRLPLPMIRCRPLARTVDRQLTNPRGAVRRRRAGGPLPRSAKRGSRQPRRPGAVRR